MLPPLITLTERKTRKLLQRNDFRGFVHYFSPSRIRTINDGSKKILRHYVLSQRPLFAKSSIAKQKTSHPVNVVCDGSPSRILSVLLISLGITIRPRSSTLLTMPVAFIYLSPLQMSQAPKAPLCKGGWQKSLISDWGIVSLLIPYNPSVCACAQPPPFTQGRLWSLQYFYKLRC